MKEIERKILSINPEEIIKHLKKIGAQNTFDGLIKTTYFDYPDSRFKKQDELLRVRLLDDLRVEIVFKTDKKIIQNSKIYTEKEFKIDPNEHDNILDFFTSIGLVKTLQFDKTRTSFTLTQENIKFEIDQYKNLEPLLEIEAPSPELIDEMITTLGLTNHEQTSESINELAERLEITI